MLAGGLRIIVTQELSHLRLVFVHVKVKHTYNMAAGGVYENDINDVTVPRVSPSVFYDVIPCT